MKKSVIAASLALITIAPDVLASETGLASIHAWRREAGKTCMVDHFHYGSGKGATKKAAETSAIQSWASFTDFEYGSTWARYTLAAGKNMNCSGSAGSWNCDVRARPCKAR